MEICLIALMVIDTIWLDISATDRDTLRESIDLRYIDGASWALTTIALCYRLLPQILI